MQSIIRKKLKIFKAIIRRIAVYMMNNPFAPKIFYTFYFNKRRMIRFISAKIFFHYKAMFIDIPIIFSKRMVRHMNINIFLTNIFAAFPHRMIFPLKTFRVFSFNPRNMSFFKFGNRRKMYSFQRFPITLMRTEFDNFFFNLIRPNLKFFITNLTSSFNLFLFVFFSKFSSFQFFTYHFSIFKILPKQFCFFTSWHHILLIKRAIFRWLIETRLNVSTLLIAQFRHKKFVPLLTTIIIAFIFNLSRLL